MESRMLHGKSASQWRKLIDSVLFKKHKYRDLSYSAGRLAEAVGLSASDLSRLLKACYGCGYVELVNSHRIYEACEMLTDTQNELLSVDEIGLMVGFRNRQSFFTAFRKYTGTTPMQYKKR